MKNNHIDYIEFKTKDLAQTKKFYSEVFGWKFTDYGPTYIAFSWSWIDGGFETTDWEIVNGVLVVLSHENLDEAKQNVITAWGKISVDTFSFPWGSRFQFLDPSGNELAVWCKDDES